ncbi:MAG: isoleucine--tRNA ligase [Miltoncostaeaceae bacterium]
MSWQPVEPADAWGRMEERALARWREERVFARSVEARRGAEPYVFYEGPPTANGRPGSHHVLSRVFKDIFPRFQTMRGRYVDRRGGWDCHGLPVELEVEKKLGISGKPEIEAYGVERFNELCRESVVTYLEEWEQLTERVGFWVDTERAYRTMDADYIESVWWSLSRLFERGLIFESHKVVPYCPRCGTALSSHEVALGYQDVVDPSVFVRFPLVGETDRSLLVWTTTPWTLPSNQGVAVNPEIDYVEVTAGDEALILAAARVEQVLGDAAGPMRAVPVEELTALRYEPPFPFIAGEHRVVPASFVSTEDGTGLVHIAPAFGADDMQVGKEHGLGSPSPVDAEGRFTDEVPPVAGTFVKDADEPLIADLDRRGRLYRHVDYEHSYPHCWRCSTPLLYMARPSWYVRTTEVADRMIASNEEIGWHPEHVRDGRFGQWLRGNVDWALSRARYWGTPLPIWRCADCDATTVVGSFQELAERATEPLGDDFDPHRPHVDRVELTCEACSGPMRREPDVIDVWYDSGAMPFAQIHHPFSGEDLDAGFPADFICEALDQTRGWFYSLHAEATLLFDEPAYRNVVCLGLILDGEGQKMSKSRGNVIEPWTVIDRQGADAFRWYLFTAQSPWDSFRFSLEAVDEAKRRFLLTLWNTYAFMVTYADLPDGWRPGGEDPPVARRRPLDRWALSRLDHTVEVVTERLEDYDATSAGRAIQDLVEDLSNWYVRPSRRSFWPIGRDDDGDVEDARAAFATLHECLATVSLLTAPFCPFVADEMYRNLVHAHDPTAPDSVHLADWPQPGGRRDPELESAVAVAREAVTVGRGARAEAKLKVRQPLAEAVIACPPATARILESAELITALIAQELNVRDVRFVTDPGDLVDVALKPNYRRLGPRFGKSMPQVAEAVAALPPAETARALDAGDEVRIEVAGATESLAPDDVLREARPAEGYAVGRAASLAVALATELDDDLELDGLAREIVHAVQGARRDAGLRVEERIVLHLDGSGRLREAIDAHRDRIATETLAERLTVGHGSPIGGTHHAEHELDGEPLSIRLEPAAGADTG